VDGNNSNKIDASNTDELKELERELFGRVIKYIFGENNLIDNVAITVLAGYSWAKNRNLDAFFNETMFVADREYAKNQLKQKYSGKTLKEIIDEMINMQAEVIWLRRVKEGRQKSPDDYENDRMRAKRYVAYLFFEDIRNNCFEKKICPDFRVKLISDEIIHLLKSLTVEDYCRIKGYLRFVDRNNGHGEEVHGYDYGDYLYGMSYLDNVFVNCKNQINIKFNNEYEKLLDNEDKISQAKHHSCYRLGCVDEETIEGFVNEYYTFIRKIFSDQIDERHAVRILRNLYNKSNSKIINMLELLLKCMIASYIDARVHDNIRVTAGKQSVKLTK
jgi:hypothetical protein